MECLTRIFLLFVNVCRDASILRVIAGLHDRTDTTGTQTSDVTSYVKVNSCIEIDITWLVDYLCKKLL
jgi:hypothetical protein